VAIGSRANVQPAATVPTGRISLVGGAAAVTARISPALAVIDRINLAVASVRPISRDHNSTDRRMKAPCPSASIRAASTR